MTERPILPDKVRLTVQVTAPDAGDAAGWEQFETFLNAAAELGLYGVELNLPDLEETIAPAALRDLLGRHGLRLTYIASGVYAARRHLALAAAEEDARAQAVRGCLANMRYAQAFGDGCGVILGTIKGTPELAGAPGADRRLAVSLREVFAESGAESPDVPVLLEATNHYEAAAVNTLEEGLEILRAVDADRLFVLPDTYHMNIEERDAWAAVRAALPKMRNIHFSDNNRYFPGGGALDFAGWHAFLQEIGYRGPYGIEGRLRGGLIKDLEESVRFLGGVL